MAKARTQADESILINSEAAQSAELIGRDSEKSMADAQLEKEEAIKQIYEMAGKVKATNFNKSQSAFFSLIMLKQVKDSKDYRAKFGMSWEQFCDHVGVSRRWIDEQLADLKPFKAAFLEDFLRFSGTTVNKIKYLGEAVAEGTSGISENAITYNGETIPLDAEHKDEIQALLETLEEEHKKQIEEKDATLSATKRVMKSKEALINKMEHEIKRLEKRADLNELTEEEQDAVNLLYEVQKQVMEGFSTIKKKIPYDTAPTIALRQLYFLLIFISKLCMDERLALNAIYQDAAEVPWEIMEEELPPADVLVDNLPMTRGMGKAMKEKLDSRG